MIYNHTENQRKRLLQLLWVLIPFFVLLAFFLNFMSDRIILQTLTQQATNHLRIFDEIKADSPQTIEKIQDQNIYAEDVSLALISGKQGNIEVVWENFSNPDTGSYIVNKVQSSSHESESDIFGKFQDGYWIANRFNQSNHKYWFVEYYPSNKFKHIKINTAIEWIGILIAALIALLIIYKIFLNYISKPISMINEGIHRVLEDDFTFKYFGNEFEEIDQLGYTVMSLKEDIRMNRVNLLASQQRLSLLLDHINLGVILIGSNHKIELFNPEAQYLMQFDHDTIGKSYETVIHNIVLIDMINHVNKYSEAKNDEIEFFIPKQRYLDVNIIPYKQESNVHTDAHSVLVLLYDMSNIRRLETIRTEFVANASHELRTPVTAIKGFAETLQDGALQDPQLADKFIRIIANESNRLEKLIHDILELSRVEKHSEPLQHEAFNLIDIIQEILVYLEVKAKVKSINIYLHSINDHVMMRTDSGRVKQILINIIDNAITYSEVGKRVDVYVSSDINNVIIRVADQGIGIPKGDQHRIFERFYRVDKGRSRNSGGTGLGLAIVRNLVTWLKGTISVESTMNVGTEFTITLPIDG